MSHDSIQELVPVVLVLFLLSFTPPAPVLRVQRHRPATNTVRFVAIGVALLAVLLIARYVMLLASMAVVAGTAWKVLRNVQQGREERKQQQALSTMLGMCVSELRCGASLGGCLEHVAQQHRDNPIAPAFAAAARSVHTGGDASAQLKLHAEHLPALRNVANYWHIAERHGIAVAPLLESAEAQLRAQIQHQQRTNAAMQGPQATAAILCVLPFVGMLLGAAMGVNVPQLLFGSFLGNCMLLLGVVLISSGLLWSQNIIRGATS